MKAFFSLSILTLFAVGLAACHTPQPPPEPVTLTDADRAAIRDSTEVFAQAARDGDWATLVMLYTDDAIVMPPNEPSIHGRGAIQESFAGSPPMTDMTLEAVEIEGYGDLAYVRGIYTMLLPGEGDSGPMEDQGKYIEIRRKQADGAWLISRDIYNSDAPVEMEPPEK